MTKEEYDYEIIVQNIIGSPKYYDDSEYATYYGMYYELLDSIDYFNKTGDLSEIKKVLDNYGLTNQNKVINYIIEKLKKFEVSFK